MKYSELKIVEWVLLFAAMGTFFSFVFLSYINRTPKLTIHRELMIDVEVIGAVENPGIYQLPLGSTISDLEELVVPGPWSYPSKSYGKYPLKEGQKIIYKSDAIEVCITGAVKKSKNILVKRHTPFIEVLEKLELLDTADIQDLKNLTLKRNGQRVVIPSNKKKVNENPSAL